MAYTFKPLPSGNVEIYENGKAISTGGGFPASEAFSLGYKPATSTPAPAPTQTPTKPAATTPAMSPAQAFVSMGATAAQSALDQGNTLPGGIAAALAAAAKDPALVAKYSDASKLDTQSFNQQLQALQASASSTAVQQSQQFESDRKQLAQSYASAGQAYSGFRNKAQQELGQQQSAVIQSTTAKQKSDIQSLVSGFESKYGSANTPSASISYANPLGALGTSLSGQNAPSNDQTSVGSSALGGITGSESINKNQDTTALAGKYYQLGTIPPMTPLQ